MTQSCNNPGTISQCPTSSYLCLSECCQGNGRSIHHRAPPYYTVSPKPHIDTLHYRSKTSDACIRTADRISLRCLSGLSFAGNTFFGHLIPTRSHFYQISPCSPSEPLRRLANRQGQTTRYILAAPPGVAECTENGDYDHL